MEPVDLTVRTHVGGHFDCKDQQISLANTRKSLEVLRNLRKKIV